MEFLNLQYYAALGNDPSIVFAHYVYERNDYAWFNFYKLNTTKSERWKK